MPNDRLKAQLDANSAAIARLQMQNQRAQAQNMQYDDYDPYYYDEPAPIYNHDSDYGDVDPNKLILQAITSQATKEAVKNVKRHIRTEESEKAGITNRMKRLVKDFPALTDESSELVGRARRVYQRIANENPGLDESTRYELAVREAASAIGARPLTGSALDNVDWVMSSQHNPAISTKPSKSRLTPAILANAKLMKINIDPKTTEGKRNLRELSEYSARFNADVDESHVKYR